MKHHPARYPGTDHTPTASGARIGWMVRAILLAVLFAVGAALAWVGYAGSETAFDAYLAARPCPADARVTADADCLVTVSAEVRRAYVTDDKYRDPHVVLTRLDAPFPLPRATPGGSLDVTLGRAESLTGLVSAGDHATVTLWKGQAVRVQADGVGASTVDVPRRDITVLTLVLALHCSLYSLVALAYARPARTDDPESALACRRARLVRLWPFSWILAALGVAGDASLAVLGVRAPAAFAVAFPVLAGASAATVVLLRPGLPPPPPHRQRVQLPSATTPYE